MTTLVPPWPAATTPAPSRTDVRLRPGRRADHDALWSLFAPVLLRAETYALPPETTRREALQYWTANDGPWFVAERAGQVVGACMIHPNQPGLGSHVANAAFVVDEAERGRGTGRRLVGHAVAAAREAGYRALQFNLVVATNASAVHLYTSLGFEVVGRVPDAFHWRRQTYVDALVLHRSLLPATAHPGAVEPRL